VSLLDQIKEAQLQVSLREAELRAAQEYLDSLLLQQVKDGPDISQFQGSVDWNTMATAGAGFAFVRTSDGDIRDTAYNGARVAAIRQAGIPFGVYHFGRVASPTNNERDGRVEAGMAVYFATSHGWGRPGDFPMAYDFETLNGQEPAKAAKHLLQFVKTYDWIMQHLPIIYTNLSTADAVAPYLTDAERVLLSNCRLWIADPDDDPPVLPSIWPNWTFHQYTTTGSLPGITGAVDLNRFVGTKYDLNALKIA
jgi:lysozyme